VVLCRAGEVACVPAASFYLYSLFLICYYSFAFIIWTIFFDFLFPFVCPRIVLGVSVGHMVTQLVYLSVVGYYRMFDSRFFLVLGGFQVIASPLPAVIGLLRFYCVPDEARHCRLIDPPGLRSRRWSDAVVDLFQIQCLDSWSAE
jgi:hypothetical protein